VRAGYDSWAVDGLAVLDRKEVDGTENVYRRRVSRRWVVVSGRRI
jgi:hypothetical protein